MIKNHLKHLDTFGTRARYGTAAEVAVLFRTSTHQIYDWARKGKIPGSCIFRIGRKMLFDMDELELWAVNGGSDGYHKGGIIPYPISIL